MIVLCLISIYSASSKGMLRGGLRGLVSLKQLVSLLGILLNAAQSTDGCNPSSHEVDTVPRHTPDGNLGESLM